MITVNLSGHKKPFAQESKQPTGAWLLFFPPYSPAFNPIENVFSKLKALLRNAAERTTEELRTTIDKLLHTFAPTECANYFAVCGGDAT